MGPVIIGVILMGIILILLVCLYWVYKLGNKDEKQNPSNPNIEVHEKDTQTSQDDIEPAASTSNDQTNCMNSVPMDSVVVVEINSEIAGEYISEAVETCVLSGAGEDNSSVVGGSGGECDSGDSSSSAAGTSATSDSGDGGHHSSAIGTSDNADSGTHTSGGGHGGCSHSGGGDSGGLGDDD